MDDRDAVARIKQGDIGGLEVLVHRYQRQALRTAYLVCLDRELAQDIAQDAFVCAYECIQQFDSQREFAPWFLRIVVNDALKATARRERNVSLEEASAGESAVAALLRDPNPGPATLAEAEATRRAVWDALGKLPAPQRAAVVMRYYLGLNEAEVAGLQACPPGTVKWRLHAARKRLRTLLAPLWPASLETGGRR